MALSTLESLDVQSVLYTLLFCALTYITIHRKTLSSNTSHRRKVGDGKQSREVQDPPLTLLFTKISKGVIEENLGLLEEYVEFGRRVGRGIGEVVEEGAGVVEVVAEDDDEGGEGGGMRMNSSDSADTNMNENDNQPTRTRLYSSSNDLLGPLPPDCILYVLMFLNCKDLVSCECVNRGWCELGGVGWMGLWSRDFRKVLSLPFLNEAYRRSLLHDPSSRAVVDAKVKGFKPGVEGWKGTYFMWRECWLEWMVAGRCGEDECLVTIGGEAFDITNFLDQHPGGFDSLVMHSGKDATKLFVDVGHSHAAKKLKDGMRIAGRTDVVGWNLGTLERVKKYYEDGRKRKKRDWEEGAVVCGDGRVAPMQEGVADFFFDPVRWTWRTWYVGIDGQGVYLD